jgi:hypothetical protein
MPGFGYCERVSDDSYSDRLKNTQRNDPCPCGSGRKYKKCHMEADEAALHAASKAAKAAAEAAAAATEAAEPAATKKESASSVERPTARQNKPARGAAGNPRPKNLPRRKAV